MGSFSHGTILDLIERQAGRQSDATAFEDADDLILSYGDVAVKTRDIRLALTANGVRRNSRVAIVMPSGVAMALALLGVSVTAIAAPLGLAYRAAEFRSYFDALRVDFLIVEAGSDTVAREVAMEMGITLIEMPGGGSFTPNQSSDCCDLPASAGNEFARPKPDDIAAILMTSGSTGRQKKVLLSHCNIYAAAHNTCRSLELRAQDRLLCMSKQHYIGGLGTLLTAPICSGGAVIYTRRFDAAEFYRLLSSKRPTWLRLAPTMIHELVSYAARNSVKTTGTSLRLIRSGGAVLTPQLAKKTEQLFGVPVIQTYGMTESVSQIASAPLPPAIRKLGSSGIAAGLEIKIFDRNGAILPAGETGEVAARGNSIFMGYEGDQEATAEALRNGWFHTGDLGYLDEDGYLFIKGRVKQMINRGGEKVNPYEVEDVMMTHSAVAQVATFAVKHPTLGEDVGAAVVVRDSASVTERELRGFVAERLASFKVPRRIVFLSQLPLGPTGKFDRQALSSMAETFSGP